MLIYGLTSLRHCIDQDIDCHMRNVVPFYVERLTLFRQTGRTIITFSYSLNLLSVFDLRRLITLFVFVIVRERSAGFQFTNNHSETSLL